MILNKTSRSKFKVISDHFNKCVRAICYLHLALSSPPNSINTVFKWEREIPLCFSDGVGVVKKWLQVGSTTCPPEFSRRATDLQVMGEMLWGKVLRNEFNIYIDGSQHYYQHIKDTH